jgi:hypothetical protein
MPAISININLNTSVLNLYPSLANTYNVLNNPPYILQDNSDGLGPYIAKWNNANPKPTPAQVGTSK